MKQLDIFSTRLSRISGKRSSTGAVISFTCNSSRTARKLIVCNGYKDENYVELALLAHKMGRRIILVVEKFNELKTIYSVARRLEITPAIGIRIKLANSGSGKWEESGGDTSAYRRSPPQDRHRYRHSRFQTRFSKAAHKTASPREERF